MSDSDSGNLLGGPMEVKYEDLGLAAGHFTCRDCGQQWDMAIPGKICASSYAKLVGAIYCPACGRRKSIVTTGFEKVEDDPLPSIATDPQTIRIENLTCLHCRMVFQVNQSQKEDIKRALAMFKEHDSSCPEHPQMRRIKELEAALAEREPKSDL